MKGGVVRNIVLRGVYRDSVQLMELSKRARGLEGVLDAAIVMATPLNKELLARSGLLTREGEAAGPSDIVIALRLGEGAEEAHRRVVDMLREPTQAGSRRFPDIDTALEASEGRNRIAVISIPGKYVRDVAIRLLEGETNLFIFSDHVPIDAEVELKRRAVSRGLLVMGPEAGTAIISGVGLGFSNRVGRGAVGVVGATGSGIQELTVLLDQMGLGISHAIGVGGRDLSPAVGGLMTMRALELLEGDPSTRVIALISKSPGRGAAEKIAEFWGRRMTKPLAVCFLGMDGRIDGLETAPSIHSLALRVARLLDEETYREGLRRIDDEARRLSSRLRVRRGYARAFYAGGALAAETVHIWRTAGLEVYSNIGDGGAMGLKRAEESVANTVIDYGAEEFTEGRPHPIIDSTLRDERARREACMEDVSAVILDLVLGYGAPGDAAKTLVERLRPIASRVSANIVIHPVATPSDPQAQGIDELEALGTMMAPSNTLAAIVGAAMAMGDVGLVGRLVELVIKGG